MILHNIDRGPQIEDVLFDWKVTGHYRYLAQSWRRAYADSGHSHSPSLRSSASNLQSGPCASA